MVMTVMKMHYYAFTKGGEGKGKGKTRIERNQNAWVVGFYLFHFLDHY